MRLLQRLNRRFLLRYRMEYALALFVVYGVRAMAPAFAWRQSRVVASLWYRLGIRRQVILDNLAVAFPELSPEEREDLARRTMRHFCSLVVDLLFQKRMLDRRNMFRRFRVTGWARDYLAEHGPEGLRARARGVLFVTAHLGNWELAAGFFSLLGVKISPVYRRMRNPFVDRLVLGLRLDSQSEFIERRGAVQRMMEAFAAGGNIGFLFDQEAAQGLHVPFFGVEAPTHKTPAVLARDHGVPVFFGVMVRLGDDFRYEARGEMLRFEATDDREADIRRITVDLCRRLEEEIRRRPEQYFWMHRRWKRVGVHGARFVAPKRKMVSP